MRATQDRMVNAALVLHTGTTNSAFSYPDYLVYRDQLRSFRGVIASSRPQFLTLTAEGGTQDGKRDGQGLLIGKLGLLPNAAAGNESALTLMVSENYFSVLGVDAVRGRVFEPGDAKELTAQPGVLISENYWRKRFDGDPGIVGKTVRLNGAAFTILGVTPHDFVGTFISVPDFWLPLSLEPLVHPTDNWLVSRETGCCDVRARLAPGATIRDAEEEMSVVADHLRSLHSPHSDYAQPLHALVWPGSPFTSPLEQNTSLVVSLLFVLVAVVMVLVVACANVASLQLARAAARQNELTMRLSLGASRMRLIRQLLTESALLGVIAGRPRISGRLGAAARGGGSGGGCVPGSIRNVHLSRHARFAGVCVCLLAVGGCRGAVLGGARIRELAVGGGVGTEGECVGFTGAWAATAQLFDFRASGAFRGADDCGRAVYSWRGSLAANGYRVRRRSSARPHLAVS